MADVNVEVEPDPTPPPADEPATPTVVIADTGDTAPSGDDATDRWVENERAHAALGERIDNAERFTNDRLTDVERRIGLLEEADADIAAAVIATDDAVADEIIDDDGSVDDDDDTPESEPRSAGPHPLFRSWHDTFHRGE